MCQPLLYGMKSMATLKRRLKKHANRRLYDTQLKRYVSLQDIRDVIVSGTDIEVEDSTSGEDITRAVLFQIMVECEQGRRPMLSETMLMSLIRQYDNPMQEYVGPFLEKSLGFYARQESRMRQQFANLPLPEGGDLFAAMRDSMMQMMNLGRSGGSDKPK